MSALGVCPEVIADAELVIAELVGNAVRHARPMSDGKLRATWELWEDHVFLLVTDGGATCFAREGLIDLTAVTTNGDPDAEHGRGLALVNALAQAWGAEQDARGLGMWALLERTRG